MPIKTILVYLPSVQATQKAMPIVAKISGAENAHVIGLHISQLVPLYTELSAELPPDLFEKLSEAGKRNAEAVKAAFDESAKINQLKTEWRCLDVSYTLSNEDIIHETRCVDLIVCAKPSDDAADPWSDFPELAVLNSGRPVLLLPSSAADFGTHAVIAWNNTRESARAVFDSLDLLRAAKTVRAVTMIDNEDERITAEEAGAKLIAALSRHGIAVSLDISFAGADEAGEMILSRLLDEGCDLLIMGGYSRSPFREMIFGGASRLILRDTWVPTLLSH